jgi:hypothetical protein
MSQFALTSLKAVGGSAIFPYLLAKGVQLGLSILALTMATGYQSQIYVEKVFINDENPPKLFMMNLVSSALQLMFGVILVLLMYMAKTLDLVNPKSILAFAFDLVGTSLLVFLIGTTISEVMYTKKYFAYKDEGLRAIRAYKDMMLYITIIGCCIPFGIFFMGMGAAITAMES